MYSDPSGFAKQCDPKVGGEKDSNSGSTTYKNSSDITKDIRKNKPLNSPAVDSWYGKNGTIVDEIACYEETVKMKLPKDYKEFCNYSEPALRKDEIRMT